MNPLRLTLALILFLVAPLSAADVAKEDLHIYLLIGQSNMAGRAPLGEATAEIEGCLLLNADNEWEAAKTPLNRYSTIRKGLGMQKLNPGSSFASAMKKANPKATIGLVVNAKGGSKIEQWATGTRFHKGLLERTQNDGSLAL